MVRNSQNGVSLTELAVVVAIIGLLLASVVGGMGLLKAAKVKKLLVEFEETKVAIDDFVDVYGYMPGDFDDAVSLIDANFDGDGDTVVEFTATTDGTPQEDLIVWDHLASIAAIRGSYSGEDATSVRYAIGTNAYPSEAFPTGVFSFFRIDTPYYQTSGTGLNFGSIVTITTTTEEGLPLGGAVSARDAFALDEKIDDGNAAKGFFYTVRRHEDVDDSGAPTTCVTGAHNASASAYQLNDSSQECHLVYWYKKD